MIMVMACVQQGDNKLSNGGVLFMDWVLQGVTWDDVLLDFLVLLGLRIWEV